MFTRSLKTAPPSKSALSGTKDRIGIYPGQYFDTETGYHYNYHRYYDPKTGRYLTPDPIGLAGGSNPYVGADPVNAVDPWGLFESHPFLRATIPGQVLNDYGWTAIENGNYGLAALYFSGMVGEQVLFALTFGESMAAKGAVCELNAVGNSASNTVGKTVLGHYPEYMELAEGLGARRFNIPTEIWNGMSEAEKWVANQKFLDRMIMRGDEIILATPAYMARAESYFARELEYLRSMGYRVSQDGMKLIK
jgi:RHS repeat-associated protein